MKKLLTVLLISVLFLASCTELGKLTEIPIPLSENITIPVIPKAGPITIETPKFKTEIDKIMSEAGVSKESVEDVTLSKMNFVMKSKDDDFSFLKSIEVFIVSADKEVEPVKIASATDISAVTTLKFKTFDEDLSKFILSEEFSLRVDLETKSPTETAKEVNIDLEVTLDLKVLGL